MIEWGVIVLATRIKGETDQKRIDRSKMESKSYGDPSRETTSQPGLKGGESSSRQKTSGLDGCAPGVNKLDDVMFHGASPDSLRGTNWGFEDGLPVLYLTEEEFKKLDNVS